MANITNSTQDVSLGDIYGVTKRTVFKAVTVVDQGVDVIAMASDIAHTSMSEAHQANARWAERQADKRKHDRKAERAQLAAAS